MNNQDLLNHILGHIRLIKDDKEKMEKLLDYIEKYIHEEKQEIKCEIPDTFKKLVVSIAQSIDCGQIVYVNLDTMQIEEIVPDMEDPEEFESNYGDCEWASKPEFYSWKNSFRIAPPISHESFKIMEDFAEHIEDEDPKFSKYLFEILQKRKPFANFKWKVDESSYRESWFKFKNQWLEDYVTEKIADKLQQN